MSRVFLGRFTACKSDFSDVGGLGATRQMVICCGIAADVAVPICTLALFQLGWQRYDICRPSPKCNSFFF